MRSFKKDFWYWYFLPETLRRNKLHTAFKFQGEKQAPFKVAFLAHSESMQFGVYQDFFNQNQIFLTIEQRGIIYSPSVDWEGHHLLTHYLYKDTLDEARKAALEAAIKIYENNE